MLEHATRRQLYDLIRQNMGLCEAELSDAIQQSRNTIKYHLKRMVRADIVRVRKEGRRLHYFSRDVHLLEIQRAVAVTQNETRRRILTFTQKNPRMSWRAISRRLGVTPRAVRWHMEKMEQLGLIDVERGNGACRVTLRPAVDAVMSGDPSKLGDDAPWHLRRPQDFRDKLVAKAWRTAGNDLRSPPTEAGAPRER